MTLKDNLAKLMASRGLNPTSLAKETGLNQPTLHRILTGESKSPRLSTLTLLAEYFGVTLIELTSARKEENAATGGIKPDQTIPSNVLRIAQHLAALPPQKLQALSTVLGIRL